MVNRLVSVGDDFTLPAAVKAADVNLPERLSSTALSATYARRKQASTLQPQPLRNVTIAADTGQARIIDVFNGYVWGHNAAGDILRRPQAGGAWATYTTNTPAEVTRVERLFPTADGEVILVNAFKIWKSSGWANPSTATWSLKVTANGPTYFLRWGADGNGTKFIATTYAAGADFPHSRYVHISLDNGNTWTVKYDSVLVHGQAAADGSHVHAVAYDPWSDRFYVSEGHSNTGDIGGIYASEDDGTTWSRAAGMSSNPAPTTITPTDDGLVCGSDNANNGLYGVVRRDNPADEVLVQTWRWQTGRDGLIGFAQRGYRDPETGVVYVSFRSNFTDVQPIIAAGTPTTGASVYTWQSGGVGADDRIDNVLVPNPDEVLGIGFAGAGVFHVSGLALPPGAATLTNAGNYRGGAASSSSSVAVGPKASTGAPTSVAVGVGASTAAVGQDQAAFGANAKTSASNATAIGPTATAGANSTVVGHNANGGTLANIVLVGRSTSASGGGDGVAAGHAATVRAQAVSVGTNAISKAGSSGGVALGYGAQADTDSVALGKGTVTSATNQVAVGARHVEYTELAADPAAPTANNARVFTRDNGAGKTQLCVRFNTGAVIVIATEP